ncbi:MAG: hypothetical protein ACI4XI_05990 [Ruminococcus sp.]
MAEKEYIEREEALNAIKNEIDNYQPNPDPYSITPYEFVRRGLNIAYSIIKNQPTADVQEVVYCKDCGSYNKRYGECTRFGAHLGEKGFCSEGKKADKE